MFHSLYQQPEATNKVVEKKTTTGFKQLFSDSNLPEVKRKVDITPISMVKSTNPLSYLGQEIVKTTKNIFSSTIEKAKSIGKDIFNLKPSQEKKGVPYSILFLNSAIDTVKNTTSEEKKRVSNFFDVAISKEPLSKKVAAGISVVSGVANVAFSPISALFAGAEQIPVLGTVSKAITLPFDVAGDIGKSDVHQLVNLLPVSKETKTNLREATDEIGALAGMIVLGGEAFKIAGSKIKELKTKFGEDGAKTIIEKATEKAKNIKVKSVEEIKPEIKAEKVVPEIVGKKSPITFREVPPTQIGEKIQLKTTPTEKAFIGEKIISKGIAPELQSFVLAATKAKNVEEFISSNWRNINPKDINKPLPQVLNEISEKRRLLQVEMPSQPSLLQAQKVDDLRLAYREFWQIDQQGYKTLADFYDQATKGIKEIKPETPTGKVSGIAKSIEAKAIEQGLTDKGFDKLAEYNPAIIKEQSKIMSDIMDRDIEMAKRISTGKESLPKELKGATALSAMEDYAMETRDGQLALDLANSPIASEISTAGQTLRLTVERTPDSATAKIREIVKEREKVVEKKLKGKTADKTKSEIKKGLQDKITKAKPSKYDWNAFVDSITC